MPVTQVTKDSICPLCLDIPFYTVLISELFQFQVKSYVAVPF